MLWMSICSTPIMSGSATRSLLRDLGLRRGMASLGGGSYLVFTGWGRLDQQAKDQQLHATNNQQSATNNQQPSLIEKETNENPPHQQYL
jgi:hypothetical protein